MIHLHIVKGLMSEEGRYDKCENSAVNEKGRRQGVSRILSMGRISAAT